MMTSVDALPDDAESLKQLLLAREAELPVATAEAATLRAEAADHQALIAHLKLQIEKLRRAQFGQRSERAARLLDQLELQLEDLEASATEDELAAEVAVARTTSVVAFTRKRPARKPFPEHLPRERVVVPGLAACACCGGTRLSSSGKTSPRRWRSCPVSGRCARSSRAATARALARRQHHSTSCPAAGPVPACWR
jgi:transposase